MPKPFAWFPTPIPDELPYSMLARYAATLPVSRPTMIDVFGTAGAILATLPIGLANFKEMAFQNRMSLERLITDHTGLPYMTSLMLPEQRQVHLNYFLPGHPEGAAARRMKRAGLRGTTPHTTLLFCPGCVASDLASGDHAGWRRTHQLPGVLVCPSCEIPLRVSDAKSVTQVLRTCPLDPQEGCELPPVMGHHVALRMALCTKELLEAPLELREPGALQRALCALIADSGWNLAARSTASRLTDRVIEEVSASPLVWGKVSEVRVHRYIRVMLSLGIADDYRKMTPLPVVAVLAALNLTVQDLREAVAKDLPWPSKIGGRKRQARTIPSLAKPEIVERHRARVLQLFKPGQRGGAGALWTKIPVSMFYLLQHDRAWLKEQYATGDVEGSRAARDEEMARQIFAARERILLRNGRPRRITASGLVLEAGISRAYQAAASRAEWPRLVAAIHECLDTVSEAAKRNLEWRAHQSVKARMQTAAWKLMLGLARHKDLVGHARCLAEIANGAIASRDPERAFEVALKDLHHSQADLVR